MSHREEFEATIDSRGSINIPAFLKHQRGMNPGVRVKVVIKIIEIETKQEVKATA